jgi:hypothetical protein
MRRKAWTGVVASLICCLAGGVALGGERDTYQSAKAAAAEAKAKAEANKPSWWWPFGSSAKDETKDSKDTKDPDESAKGKESGKDEEKPPKPIVAPIGQEGANLISREQAKFLRRQQACDRLRQIAQETGDLGLEQQAQLLEQRAWFIYEQRTAQARLPSLLPIEDDGGAAHYAQDHFSTNPRDKDRPIRSISTRKGNSAAERKE